MYEFISRLRVRDNYFVLTKDYKKDFNRSRIVIFDDLVARLLETWRF